MWSEQSKPARMVFLSKPINKVALLKHVETMLKFKDTRDELERLRAYIREMEEQVR